MREKKNIKKATEIVFIIIIICLLALGCVLDTIIGKEHYENESVVVMAISFLTLAFTLWFSYLFIIKQLYENRFCNKSIGRIVFRGSKSLIFLYVALLIVGIIILFVREGLFFFSIAYVIDCVLLSLLCGLNIYFGFATGELNNVIKDKVESVFDSIKISKDFQKISNEFEELVSIYDDAYLRNEKMTCVQVIDAYFVFWKTFIENRNKDLMDGVDGVKDAWKACRMFQAKLFKDEDSVLASELNRKILRKIRDLIFECLKCEIDSFMDTYLDSIITAVAQNECLLKNQAMYVFSIFAYLESKAMELDKKEFFRKFIKKAETVYFIGINELKERVDGQYWRYLSKVITDASDKYMDYADLLFSELQDSILNRIGFDNEKIAYGAIASIFSKKVIENNKNIKQGIYKLVKNLIDKGVTFNDEFMAFIGWISKQYAEIGESDMAFDIRYCFVESVIDSRSVVATQLFPDFVQKAMSCMNNEDEVKQLSGKLDYLVYKALSRNRIGWVNQLLSVLKECILNTQQKDKIVQEMWISTYQRAINIVAINSDYKMQYIVLESYKEVIVEMDSKKIISKSLMKKVIDDLSITCESHYRQNVDFICEIIETINAFLDNKTGLSLILEKEVRVEIYKNLFDIAVNSIEKGQELVIQQVSNAFGWRIKSLIENGYQEDANLLLDYAFQMYKLCILNKISEQTIVFIGTLFVVIGAFASTKKPYYKYRNKIIDNLSDDLHNKNYLYVAKMLRESNVTGWTSLLGETPKVYFNEFWHIFDEKCNKPKK